MIIFINESGQESEEHIKQVALQIEEYCKDVVVARKQRSAAISCAAPASSSSHATSDRVIDLLVGDECAMDLLDPAVMSAIQSGQQGEQFEEPIDLDTQMVLDETFEDMDLEVGQPIESCNGSDPEQQKRFCLGNNLQNLIGRGDTVAGLQISDQSRILIATVAERLKMFIKGSSSCDKSLLLIGASNKQLIKEFLKRMPPKKSKGKSLAERLAGSLMCMSPNTVSGCWQWVSVHGAVPKPEVGTHDPDAAKFRNAKLLSPNASPEVDEQDQLANKIVKRQLLNSTLGRPYSHTASDLLFMLQDGMQLPSKLLGRWTLPILEYLGGQSIRSLHASLLYDNLEGLQIPSDIELFWDGVTLGKLFRSCRSTLLLCGAIISTPEVGSGRSAVFLASPSETTDARSPAQFQVLLDGLRASPLDLSLRYLQKTLASVNVDGQYSEGENSLHSPLKVAYLLWERLHRKDVVVWDDFHRCCKAGSRAINRSQTAQDFFRCLKDLEAAFGGGQGRQLNAQYCEHTGVAFRTGKVVCNTRQWGYLCDTPSVFLEKHPEYYVLIECRRIHSEEKPRRTGFTTEWWVELGKKVASLHFIVFVMFLQDILQRCKPHVLTVQTLHDLPTTKKKAYGALDKDFGSMLLCLDELKIMLLKLQWLRGYLVPNEIKRFLTIFCVYRIGKIFPIVAVHLPTIALDHRFCGNDILLDTPERHPAYEFLHPACQCSFRRATPLKYGKLPGGLKCHPRVKQRDPSLISSKFGLKTMLMATWSATHSVLLDQSVYQPNRSVWDFERKVHREEMRQPAHLWCKMRRKDISCLEKLLHALRDVHTFLLDLKQEYAHYHGKRGVTDHVDKIWNAFHEAFDFNAWMEENVNDQLLQDSAFSKLWVTLWPDLAKTFWPKQDAFPESELKRNWPFEPPLDEFHVFQQKIRREFARQTALENGPWLKITGYTCTAVLPLPPVCRLWRSPPFWILALVWTFLAGSDCSQTFIASSLHEVQNKTAMMLPPCVQLVFLKDEMPNANFGLAICKLGKKRCFVIFAKVLFKVDDLQVILSVENTRSLCKGTWRVARILHRASHIGCSSQMAESWASILGRQYDSVAGLSSGNIVSRALLRIGGFRGNGEDDHIVQMVAQQVKGSGMHADRALRGFKQAGLSTQEIATMSLMKQLEPLKNHASHLLTSKRAIDLSNEVTKNARHKMHLSNWRVEQKKWTVGFDCTKISDADLEVFQKFDSVKQRPSLPLMNMTRLQRLRFNQLALSERRKRRAKYLAESQKKMLMKVQQEHTKRKGKKRLPTCVRPI